MSTPTSLLVPAVQQAIADMLGPEHRDTDPVIRPSHYADVQINAPLALAKRVGRSPRELAQDIVGRLDGDARVRLEVSGPGFVNVTFDDTWLASLVDVMARDGRLGVPVHSPSTIVIDYSAPNVAKEMHVAHIRTTIVGDALARMLEHLGHRVVRQNHIGDWGTNFGMLIEHLVDVGEDSPQAAWVTDDPNRFYQAARDKFRTEPDFAERSRRRVVALQAGDPDTLRHWHRLIDLSKHYFNLVYRTLGVTLTDDDLAGESTYNDQLAGIADELEASGLAVLSDGALCVFLDGFVGRDDKPVPLIVRKSGGGYGYDATDLATIRHRVRELQADRILYVVGAPQALHFEMIWQTARLAGWLPPEVDVEHIKIGNVLGNDRRILRTREGDTPKLMDMLREAEDRARAHIDRERPELPDEERARIAHQVGVGGVKYADLSVSHDAEYVFDLERMLSLTGNTGPYLQYAAARIRSMFRQAGVDPAMQQAPVTLQTPAERELALRLLEFGAVVEAAGRHAEPHRLCGYLFETAQAFSAFYEQCPILKADDEAVRSARMTLAAVTLRVIVEGLHLVGVESPERM